ncbi:DUF350 domain-containing protein [Thalassoporum mexicanum]
MEVVAKVGATIGWSVLGVVLLYGAVWLFDLIDPIDYQAEIKGGNMAAGLTQMAVVLAMAAIIISVIIT